MDHNWFFIVAVIAVCSEACLLLLALFDPGLRYKITSAASQDLDSEDFLCTLEAIADAKVHRRSDLEVHANGENFYEAELEAIRRAERSVNLEAYIFQRGKVTERFVKALTDCARRGVKVNLLMDALGSLTTTEAYLKELLDAGGKVAWYHPMRWNTWPRYNNRTHRELLVIDGRIAFIGGAGIADHWLHGDEKHPRWRDTMVRVEGEIVASLQGTFSENWLESCGEVLLDEAYYPRSQNDGDADPDDPAMMVINSAPSAGGSTRARVLFQTLIASAKSHIHITTPYFLPDASLRKELERALRRGVEVKVLTPGRKSDHALTRRSSRRLYGPLLEAGAKVFEYQPSMLHAKILTIDGLWSVVGSTNFDNRSFGINDEVNLAIRHREVAERFQSDFEADLEQAKPVTLREWKHRNVFERAHELLGWILERQQ